MASSVPATRARTSTESIATKRPIYSSCSVTVCLTGLATVTCGGAGAACCLLSPQAARSGASTAKGAIKRNEMNEIMRFRRIKAGEKISPGPGRLKGRPGRPAKNLKPSPPEQRQDGTAIDHRTDRHKQGQTSHVAPCSTVMQKMRSRNLAEPKGNRQYAPGCRNFEHGTP